ncbi:uncharacterized protein LOC129601989 [Paramacrobiotus metropolitanus]|uniref:uncharacterized protein LOC129601989 n=1 Tax=Paramacrobiotus metropolitanus TaxID=2943436 RepID=UPI002445811D|nr:uncharacterized protein LOC129601989 [Paramacrobiotus metropolitanus]
MGRKNKRRITLSNEQLQTLLPWLEQQFPSSLPVYHMACNIMENRFSFPKTIFIVDKLPTPSVIVCKLMCIHGLSRTDARRGYIPAFNGHQLVFVYAEPAKKFVAFRAMLRDVSALFNWRRNMTFIDVDPGVGKILLSLEDRDFALVPSTAGRPNGELVFNFDLVRCEFQRYPVPDDLMLGRLRIDHAEQIVEECHYVNPSWIKVFQYLLFHGYPSMALFDSNDMPIAYCMYMPHGCISAVYVHPSHRNRNLFRLVLGELLVWLQTREIPSVWMQTMNFPLASQLEVIRGFGGEEFRRGYAMCWMTYRAPRVYRGPLQVAPDRQHIRRKTGPRPNNENLTDDDCGLQIYESATEEDGSADSDFYDPKESSNRKIREILSFGKPGRSRGPGASLNTVEKFPISRNIHLV